MSETRRRIRDAVARDPGIHFNAIVRDLALARGQVQYHLRRLRESGSVVRHERFGRTHYYPPAYDERERDAIAALRRETAAAVVAALCSRGSTAPGDLVATLEVPRSTLEHHLERLEACDLIERRRLPGNRVELVPVDHEAAVGLLEAIETDPRAAGVDRFERLVDSLLEFGDGSGR